MKIFERKNKINFVDKNNVFVGYDLESQCCEDANWFINPQKITSTSFKQLNKLIKEKINTDDYVFDPQFFEQHISNMAFGLDSVIIIFKLIKPNYQPLYLHIFNVHNGYYAHGFVMKINEKIVRKDWL